jgi:hypothetical protein
VPFTFDFIAQLGSASKLFTRNEHDLKSTCNRRPSISSYDRSSLSTYNTVSPGTNCQSQQSQCALRPFHPFLPHSPIFVPPSAAPRHPHDLATTAAHIHPRQLVRSEASCLVNRPYKILRRNEEALALDWKSLSRDLSSTGAAWKSGWKVFKAFA